MSIKGPEGPEDTRPSIADAEEAGSTAEEIKVLLMRGELKPPDDDEPLGFPEIDLRRSRIVDDPDGNAIGVASIEAIERAALEKLRALSASASDQVCSLEQARAAELSDNEINIGLMRGWIEQPGDDEPLEFHDIPEIVEIEAKAVRRAMENQPPEASP
ncbi:MAG: hypothetical protein O3B47_02685 [bacterium]|nr:hypothetical protein [bacterium]